MDQLDDRDTPEFVKATRKARAPQAPLQSAQPQPFKPAIVNDVTAAVLENLKVRDAIKIGNNEKIFFSGKDYQMRLMVSGLIKLKEIAKPSNIAFTHVNNLVYFTPSHTAE